MSTNRVTVKKKLDTSFLDKLKGSRVVVGLPRDSAPYPDGTSVIDVAVDHEFGVDSPRTYTSIRGNTVSVSGIPKRSFMRTTFDEKNDVWIKKSTILMRRAIRGSIKFDRVMKEIGLFASADIKLKIVEINSPPNSPQVIADKGSSNPLVDTGHLIDNITYEVRS